MMPRPAQPRPGVGKKTVYVEETYPHPLEIMTEIRQLESEITSGLAELEAMLRE